MSTLHFQISLEVLINNFFLVVVYLIPCSVSNMKVSKDIVTHHMFIKIHHSLPLGTTFLWAFTLLSYFLLTARCNTSQ